MAHSNRIALCAGANPKKCVTGPTVRLPLGKWRLNVHGKIDSKITMYIGSHCIGEIHDGGECEVISNPDDGVRVHFAAPGSEDYITVIASLLVA
jgi:hypothetical protein